MADGKTGIRDAQRAAYAERRVLPQPRTAPPSVFYRGNRSRSIRSIRPAIVIGIAGAVLALGINGIHMLFPHPPGSGGSLVAVRSEPEQVGRWQVQLLGETFITPAGGRSWFLARWSIENRSGQALSLSRDDFFGGSPGLAQPDSLALFPSGFHAHPLRLGLLRPGQRVRGDTAFPLLAGHDRASVQFEPLAGNPMGDGISWSAQQTTRHMVVVIP